MTVRDRAAALATTLFVALALAASRPAGADESLLVTLSLGDFDIGDGEYELEGGIEVALAPKSYRFLPERLHLRPIIGAAAHEGNGWWAYAGIRLDHPLSRRWWLSPSFAVSNFDPGDGKQLGGALEFRSAIEVAVAIERGRLGLCFYHLSNGSYYDDNPGSNSLVLTLVMDFGRRAP